MKKPGEGDAWFFRNRGFIYNYKGGQMNKTFICIDYVPYYNLRTLQNPLLIEQKTLQIAQTLIQ